MKRTRPTRNFLNSSGFFGWKQTKHDACRVKKGDYSVQLGNVCVRNTWASCIAHPEKVSRASERRVVGWRAFSHYCAAMAHNALVKSPPALKERRNHVLPMLRISRARGGRHVVCTMSSLRSAERHAAFGVCRLSGGCAFTRPLLGSSGSL